MKRMNLNLDVEQEEDGRWLAEVLEASWRDGPRRFSR